MLDDLDEFVGFVALGSGVVDEVFGAFDESAFLRGSGDRDSAAAAEFEQAFFAELSEGAEDGVGVYLEDSGEIFGRGESFAWLGFSVGDGAADFGCDLFVEVEGVVAVDLDIPHGVSHYSAIR